VEVWAGGGVVRWATSETKVRLEEVPVQGEIGRGADLGPGSLVGWNMLLVYLDRWLYDMSTRLISWQHDIKMLRYSYTDISPSPYSPTLFP
jgi:hypothetical protein